MTGHDLILLAGKLTANPGLGDAEARFRSAVSRAYYGAFHFARAFVEEMGAVVPKNATGHFELSRLLWDTAHADAQQAADHLDDLRRERNRADYDQDSTRFRKQVNAVQCVELADDIRSAIDRCREEPALSVIRAALGSL
ncbi:MAG: HEPN domain-containing protein [Planctomycetes bacterium]|nr:HEPN domain-containing protein [Planctomycetota bacterium]